MVLWRRHIAGNNTPYLGLHVKCPKLLSDCNRIWTFSTEFHVKYRNIKFHVNPSSWGRADTFGQKDGHDEANSRFPELGERALKQNY